MAIFINERRCIPMCMVVGLVLLQVYLSTSESQDTAQNSLKHRRRRQAGDFVLMGYKAQGALGGGRKPSEFFRRIGKKWSNRRSIRLSRFVPDERYLSPDVDEDLLVDPDDVLERWLS